MHPQLPLYKEPLVNSYNWMAWDGVGVVGDGDVSLGEWSDGLSRWSD